MKLTLPSLVFLWVLTWPCLSQAQTQEHIPGIKPPKFSETIWTKKIEPPALPLERTYSPLVGPVGVEQVTFRKLDDPRPCLRRGCYKSTLWLNTTFLSGMLPHPWEQWMKDKGAILRMSFTLDLGKKTEAFKPPKEPRVGIKATLSW